MATTGNTYLTLADLFKQQDGNGQVTSQIIELLAETNPILTDMIVQEANNGTGHLTTVRTGLPAGTWRKLYQGVQPQKSTTKQVTDATGMLEARSEIDAKLVQLSKNPGQFRLNEATAFLEGMNQDMAGTLFYGDTDVNPERFMGLAPRFNAYRDPANIPAQDTADQVIDGGGTGADNTSVWFIVWGERTVHGIYPQGTMAGLQRKDLGEIDADDPAGGKFRAMAELFNWDNGLSVRDFRYVVRIANIDVSDLRAGTVDIYSLMRKAYYRLFQRKVTGGRAAIYCNRDVLEALDAGATPTQSTSASYVRLSPMEVDGREVMGYRGMPVRECDAILNTEAAVPSV
ncbi:major capsid protein [Halomonas salifodinae]|uniref:Major capsid protein n=1 Tax=Halomonas salifodinae TaxID=438745 RepID=A0ABW2EYC3_9GAMM